MNIMRTLEKYGTQISSSKHSENANKNLWLCHIQKRLLYIVKGMKNNTKM